MKANLPDQMRILCIGAHPDDCEFSCSGIAAMWSRVGHEITFLSVTDGASGHHESAGPALVQRRAEESFRAARIIGAKSRILPFPDGYLEPILHYRLTLIRVIREIEPHIIITNRPNDYHPDHRYTAQMVQDAAYSLMVPNIAPEVKAMEFNPTILHWWDRFSYPEPFSPSIAVSIDQVFELKLAMLHEHESQVYEWLPYVGRVDKPVPTTDRERKTWLKWYLGVHQSPPVADMCRGALRERYGTSIGDEIEQAEAYSLCEYGAQPDPEELERIFRVAFDTG